MRTTVNLDDDVLAASQEYARSRSVALGKAISELVRKGIRAEAPTRIANGLVVFDLPPGGPKVTSEQIKAFEADAE
jgi:hypothetical protein